MGRVAGAAVEVEGEPEVEGSLSGLVGQVVHLVEGDPRLALIPKEPLYLLVADSGRNRTCISYEVQQVEIDLLESRLAGTTQSNAACIVDADGHNDQLIEVGGADCHAPGRDDCQSVT